MMICKRLGRFNLIGDEKSWVVSVTLPDGRVLSTRWDEDDEPHIDRMTAIDAVEFIAERLTHWICSSQEENDDMIAWCREHPDELNDAWARDEIKKFESGIKLYQQRIEDLKEFLVVPEVQKTKPPTE